MEYLKYLISAVIGAFIAGVGFVQYFNDQIDKKINVWEQTFTATVIRPINRRLKAEETKPVPVPKVSIKEGKYQDVQSTWVPGDSSCTLQCPSGYVLKSFGYENPNGASDCGKYRCVSLTAKVTK